MKASVIMSVYNTREDFLRECIDSILNQTEKDFEFIIIDDNCNKKTRYILESYKDSRIVLIINNENKGLTYNLNRALDLAQGQYIFRMDADDVSHIDRIRQMTQYMDENDNINILGSYMNCDGIIRKYYGNIPWEIRKTLLLFDNAGLGHPSVVFRKSFLDKFELKYDVTIRKSQDFELWTRCVEYTNLHVYKKSMVDYRIHEDQITTKCSEEQKQCMKCIKERQLMKFRPFISDEDIHNFSVPDRESKLKLGEYRRIHRNILKANKHYKYVSQDILWYVLRKKYTEYLNYHNINLYRLEKYLIVPFNKTIKKYTGIIISEDDNYSYLPK